MDVSFAFSGGNSWGGQGDQKYHGASSTQRQNSYDKTPIPATISDLLKVDNSEEKFRIGTYSFHTVKVMGIVVSSQIDQDQTCVTYELKDPARQKIKSEQAFTVIRYHGVDSFQRAKTLDADTYVRAIGKLRTFNNRISLVSFQIAEVSVEEVELFQLEATVAMLYYGKGIPECSAQQIDDMGVTLFDCHAPHKGLNVSTPVTTPARSVNEVAVGNGTVTGRRLYPQEHKPNNRGQQARNSLEGLAKRAYVYRQTELDSFVVSKSTPMVQSPLTKNNNNYYLNNNPPTPTNPHGLVGQQAKIYDYVRRYGTGEAGVSVKQICAALNVDEDRAFADIGMLVNRSVLYSTIDEQHFASIDD